MLERFGAHRSRGDRAVRPTRVRHLVLAVATLASLVLYLHRVCVAELLKDDGILRSMGLDARHVGWTFSAFFWTYAAAQVPSGWMGDRFGRRLAMTMSIVAWSVAAGTVGLVHGFAMMFALRLALGAAQAGAYPTSAGLMSQWMPLATRGRASSVVAAGGRFGGAVAPYLTAVLVADFDWRQVMFGYGAVGVVAGALYWLVARNTPAEHPWTNAAERELILSGRATASDPESAATADGRADARVPWLGLATSSSMWLMCLSQFMTNIGWVFLITYMPKYLSEAHRSSSRQGGFMATCILAIGMLGMLSGGWLTDAAVRRLGLRLGRMLPLAATRFVAAAAYLFASTVDEAWPAAAALALVAFATDCGTGASWGFAQDVGGRNVGAVLGWGNMFGNFGAAAGPLIIGALLGTNGDSAAWSQVLLVLAAAFGISGLAAMGIDASRPIRERAPPRPHR